MKNQLIYIIINNSLYYMNYCIFYVILIFLFKKNIIPIFKKNYKKYITDKKNNYIILKEENKKLLSFKKNSKEKNNNILFLKKSIENYIIIKKNEQKKYLKDIINKEEINYIEQKNIEKTLYQNDLLYYSKKSFKNILFSKFNKETDITFILKLIKVKHKNDL